MDLSILRVTTPDGQVREYPLDVASVYIGRAEGNRVVIDHVSVSRRHARLDFVGGEARLDDLSSATGTYVGGQRLVPGSPRSITPSEPLRIGDCQAVLISNAAAPSGGGAPAAAGGAFGGRPEQAIAISVTAPSAPVAPGAAVTATVVVENRGAVVDTVQVAIRGLPESWVRITRPVLSLNPEARDEVVVVIQPPREPASKAGEYQFAAAATSSQHGVEVRALGRLTVLPFGAPLLEVRPAQGRGPFRAVVDNQSNTTLNLSLAGRDDADAIAFAFEPAEFALEPGERAEATVRPRLRDAGFFGGEVRRRFTVEASGAAQPVSDGAELQYRSPWLLWRWFALALLVFAIGAGGWFGYNALAGDDGTTPAGGGDTPTTTTTATATTGAGTTVTEAPSETATPTPPADGSFAVGSRVRVVNSPVGDCVRLRDAPQVTARELSSLCDGAVVTITEGRTEAGGFYFYKVERDDGGTGYASSGPVDGSQVWFEAAE